LLLPVLRHEPSFWVVPWYHGGSQMGSVVDA